MPTVVGAHTDGWPARVRHAPTGMIYWRGFVCMRRHFRRHSPERNSAP